MTHISTIITMHFPNWRSLRHVVLILIISTSAYALYDADVDIGVYVLNDENFNSTVYQYTGSHLMRKDRTTGNVTWIVQFYNSWCGHCIKFAPTYKALAKKLQHWKDVVRLGTVDCSYNFNRPLCSRFQITATPAIRTFAPYSDSSSLGDLLEAERTVTGIMHQILDLMEFQSQREELASLPDKPIHEIWLNLPASVDALAVIVEPLGSYVGKESIMHLHPNLQAITARRAMSTNQKLLNSLKAMNHQPPFVVFLQRNLINQQGIIDLNTLRESDPVQAFCEAILRADTELTNRNKIPRRLPLGPVYGQTEIEDSRPTILASASQNPPPSRADMTDVNAALIYAISHEVASREVVTGRPLDALRVFVRAVIKYLPVRADILMAFRQLDTALLRQSSILGEEILQVLRESGLNFDQEKIRWGHCKGSVAHLRGYPCGLWTTFHMLTVRAYETDPPTQNAIGNDGALSAAMSYIEHLFSCEECSRHFVKYAESIRRYNVAHLSNADAALFLWRAHNSANRRLAGDLSEDPAHPKVQWPGSIQCPRCRATSQPVASDVWNEQEVLKFLQRYYGRTPVGIVA
ncbi:sulfhydryl oxidase 2-like [Paramacrobiotus metropolitanus]|uniref:sulfhydryl oxidase 2-like n=1 Tax=Paramacrobiotus metropolitanus TaxID=2943436 RepID=UPI0024464265|nr:sulfhydryl oxidase 2-like [Paramacrobiotus metropolitanus]